MTRLRVYSVSVGTFHTFSSRDARLLITKRNIRLFWVNNRKLRYLLSFLFCIIKWSWICFLFFSFLSCHYCVLIPVYVFYLLMQLRWPVPAMTACHDGCLVMSPNFCVHVIVLASAAITEYRILWLLWTPPTLPASTSLYRASLQPSFFSSLSMLTDTTIESMFFIARLQWAG